MSASVAYFIFKIYRIYDESQVEKYRFVKEFLTFFGKTSPAYPFIFFIDTCHYSNCIISVGRINNYQCRYLLFQLW